jgi:hypothetical protein
MHADLEPTLLALDAYLADRYGGGLADEQRECLEDPARHAEALGMLDDMEGRLGVPSHVCGVVAQALEQRTPRALAAVIRGHVEQGQERKGVSSRTGGADYMAIRLQGEQQERTARLIADEFAAGAHLGGLTRAEFLELAGVPEA